MPKGRTRGERRAPLVPGSGPLARVPAAAAFFGVLVVFGLSVWLGGPLGAILLGVLAAGVALLLVAAWRRLAPVERVLRLVVLAVLVVITVSLLLARH